MLLWWKKCPNSWRFCRNPKIHSTVFSRCRRWSSDLYHMTCSFFLIFGYIKQDDGQEWEIYGLHKKILELMISNFTKDSITCMLTTFALPNSSDGFRPQAILTCLVLFYGVRDGCHGAVADMFIGWRDAQLEDWRWPVWSSHDCKSSQTAAGPSWSYQELIGKLGSCTIKRIERHAHSPWMLESLV